MHIILFTEAAKGMMTPIKRLAAKAEQFRKCVRKAEGHLRRLGDENDKERFVAVREVICCEKVPELFLY